MAATTVRCCFGSDGVVQQVVVPDTDNCLNDAAFSPQDCVNVDVRYADYTGWADVVSILVGCVDAVNRIDSKVGAEIQAEIAALLTSVQPVIQQAKPE